MQPYQQATEAELGRKEAAGRLVQTVLPYAKVAGGLALASRVAPFLSKYIPAGLMVKGISKISPRMGNFVQHALDLGHDENEVKEFIGDKVENQQEQSPQAIQGSNIVRQVSPELDEFMQSEIKAGRPPVQAGALAELESGKTKGFRKAIAKLVKSHRIPWSTIVRDTYGDQNMGQPKVISPELTAPQTAAPMQQAPQMGPGAQAVNSVLSKILSHLEQ